MNRQRQDIVSHACKRYVDSWTSIRICASPTFWSLRTLKMQLYTQTTSSGVGLAKGSYIYNIIQTGTEQLACINSDDTIRLVNIQALSVSPTGICKNAHKGITSIKAFDTQGSNSLLTCGRDGLVKIWDPRLVGSPTMQFQAPKNQPLSMVEGSAALNTIVAGVESDKDGPGDVSIFGWDVRNPSALKLEYAESHTDTVTELRFLPGPDAASSPYLLSASTDGLINIYNTNISEEDDAVFQVINHKSAVHHAGLLNSDVYAIGTDETISFYSQQDQSSEEAIEPPPVHLGDVRDALSCNYIVRLAEAGGKHYIACGKAGESQDEQYLDLITLNEPASDSLLAWTPDASNRFRLQGGHGEELVRDVLPLESANRVFTCGEDGFIRCWQGDAQQDVEMGGTKTKKRRKDHESRKEKRPKRNDDA